MNAASALLRNSYPVVRKSHGLPCFLKIGRGPERRDPFLLSPDILLRCLHIDLLRPFGRFRQHADMILQDIDKTTARRKSTLAPAPLTNFHFTDADLGKHGRMIEEDLKAAEHTGGAEADNFTGVDDLTRC